MHDSVWFLRCHYIFIDKSKFLPIISVFASENGWIVQSFAIKGLFFSSMNNFGSISEKYLGM